MDSQPFISLQFNWQIRERSNESLPNCKGKCRASILSAFLKKKSSLFPNKPKRIAIYLDVFFFICSSNMLTIKLTVDCLTLQWKLELRFMRFDSFPLVTHAYVWIKIHIQKYHEFMEQFKIKKLSSFYGIFVKLFMSVSSAISSFVSK